MASAVAIHHRMVTNSPLTRLQKLGQAEDRSPAAGSAKNDLTEPLQPTGEELKALSTLKAKEEHAHCMGQANTMSTIIMAVLFGIVAMLGMYNGLKCVSFNYTNGIEAKQGACFAAILILSYLEYFLAKDWLEKATEEKGELIPSLHMHELFFELGLENRMCAMCHETLAPPHCIGNRCRTCDWAVCLRCCKKSKTAAATGKGPTTSSSSSEGGKKLSTWGYFWRIVKMTAESGWMPYAAMCCLVGSRVSQIWAPNVTGDVFNGIIAFLDDPSSGRSAFESAIVMYLIVNMAQGGFSGLQMLFQDLVLRRLACSVRMNLFWSLLRMDISFFDTMHTGQLTIRLEGDASCMVQPLDTLMNDLVANIMLLVGGSFMAFNTSWQLSMLSLSTVPPITYTYRCYAEWGHTINNHIYGAYGEAMKVATEAIQNIRTVRGFSTEVMESRKYNEIMTRALGHAKSNAVVSASVSAFSSYVNLGTAVLILWYGGSQVCDSLGQKMTLGSLITYQLYWNMMNNAFISLGNVFNDLIISSSAAERVFSLMDKEPEVDPDKGIVVTRESMRGHIRLEKVQFRYRARPEKLVLRGVDMDMQPGTITALVGKSGGGKSTLVHLLMRFYEPTGGAVLLDGVDTRELSSRSVRAFCGFVAQDTQLFAKSIRENVAYGLESASDGEIIAACQAANAHEFIMEMDDGYDTLVGERGLMLSGGQRQRLAIARCFLRKPVLLFLDEATSALDAENEALVQEAFDALMKSTKCTVVLIAHRLSTVINATQIAVVHKGEIIECGPHERLLDQGGIYAKLVQRQISRDASTVADAKKGEGAGGKGQQMQDDIDELIAEMEDPSPGSSH